MVERERIDGDAGESTGPLWIGAVAEHGFDEDHCAAPVS
jgi:hypothetical protein